MPKKPKEITEESEIRRLTRIYKNLPPNEFAVAQGLIVQAARLRVRLNKLWQDAGQVTNTGTWTSTGMTYTDLLNIIAALPTQYATNAKFATTRKVFFGSILGIKTDSGDKVVVADAQSPAKFNILGYPVIVDDNCKADTVIFGDLKEYKLNFAKAIEVAADTSVGFRFGSTVYRAMCLADGKIADKNAFTVYTKGE